MNSTKQAKVRRIYQKVPDIKKSYCATKKKKTMNTEVLSICSLNSHNITNQMLVINKAVNNLSSFVCKVEVK